MNKAEAFKILKEFNAPEHLITHVSLVGEAASEIMECLIALGVEFDSQFLESGVVLHDLGKVKHTQEMYEKGSDHENEGERLLLEKGVDPKLARVCVSHGQWSNLECSLEELLIALSDKLWKGKRVQELEEKVIKLIADAMHADYWDLFTKLDSCFENVASKGDQRLSRSVRS